MRFSNHYNHNNSGRPAFRARPQFGNRGRKIRSFDPTNVAKNAVGQAVVPALEFKPVNTFSDFGLADQIKANIAAHNYINPTPIQDQVIPLMMAGKDVVGIANTGTGKTAAFLLPLIDKIIKDRRQRVLIVAPTRELAVQIEQEFRQFSWHTNMWSALCIGGVGMGKQISDLNRNPGIVVGTPGRLLDLAEQGRLRLNGFNNVILDEVDRMLDMGFIKDVSAIISKLSTERQSAFFSATSPENVQTIMRSFLKNPVTISVKTSDNLGNVAQNIIKMNGKPKIEVLHNLLIQQGFDKVLVFGRTKHGLDKLGKDLVERGFRIAIIHGNKSQGQRQASLQQFKNNRVKVLLATDVASRGLDIDNVTHVINYDLPESYEDYIHRIGRTGRADKKGIALTLVEG